jgi:hypothetical protein
MHVVTIMKMLFFFSSGSCVINSCNSGYNLINNNCYIKYTGSLAGINCKLLIVIYA